MIYRAKHRYADVSSRKLRPFAQLVRGKNVDEALQLLRFYPNRGAKLLLAVVQSAYGNATDQESPDPDSLIVKECRVARFMLVEFLRLALALVGAHKVLQRGLAVGDRGLNPRDLFFQFVDTVLDLLALDGVQSFLGRLYGAWGFGAAIAVVPTSRNGGEKWGTRSRLGFRRHSGNIFKRGYGLRAALLAPEVVLVVPGVDVDLSAADLENARGQPVDEIAIV